MKKILLMIYISITANCAQTNQINQNEYSDTQITIEDTFKKQSSGSAFFFYVAKIDGVDVPNAASKSMDASVGQTIYMSALGFSRKVYAKPIKLHLVAAVFHSAPIGYLFDSKSKFRAEGEVDFEPVPKMTYYVKGNLSKEYSSVWIEDRDGNIVSQRIGTFDPALNHIPQKYISATDQQKASTENTRTNLFLRISEGESVESVVEKLGPPDEITERKASVFAGPPAHDFTIYSYNDLGKIQIFGVKPHLQSVENIAKAIQLSESPTIFKAKIDSTDSAELRLLAKDFYLTNTPTIDYLDVVAEIIWKEKNTKDPSMEDAMAYFCLILGKSTNARYSSFLEMIQKESKSNKIRKNAKKSLSQLLTNETDKFIPSPQN